MDNSKPTYEELEQQVIMLHNQLISLKENKQQIDIDSTVMQDAERFQQIFHCHDAVMFLIKPKSGKIIEANRAAATYYGYSRDELCEMSIAQINQMPSDNVKEEMEAALREKRNKFVFPHRLKNGEIRTVEVLSNPITLSGEKLLFSIISDITEYKKSEENLFLFRNLMEQSNDAIYIIEPDSGCFIDVNARACSAMGYSKEEFMRMRVIDIEDKFISTDDWNQHIKDLRMIPKSQIVVDGVHKRKDGSTFQAEIGIRLIKSSDKEYMVSIARDISERKINEETLKQKTALLEAQLNSSIDGILIVDPLGKKIIQNQRTVELWKIPKHIAENDDDELQVKHVMNLTKNPEQFIEKVLHLYKHPDEKTRDIVELTDGTVLDRYSAPVLGEDGKNHGRIWLFRDVTEQKIADEKISKSHDLLTNLTSLVPGVVYQYRLYPDGSSAFPYSSPGMNDIYEVTPEEVREDATVVFERLHPDDYDHVSNCIQESARLLETFYCEFRVILPRQGLRWRWSEAQPQRMEDGSILWHGILLDITDRKLAEEKLQHNLELLNASQEIGRLGSYELDIAGNTWSNSTVLDDIFGIDETFERTAQGWLKIVHPDWKEIMGKYLMEEVIGQGCPFDKEYKIIRISDGAARWVHGFGRLEKDSEGNPVSMVGTIQDITERKLGEEEKSNLQSQLFQSQKMEAIGHLAGGMAHDFNNMLGVILSAVELARFDMDVDSPAQEELKTITEAVKRARELTMKLLTFSRKEKIEVRSIAVRKIIEDLSAILSRTIPKSIKLKTVMEDDCVICCDSNQIHQVLVNVCNNAVDAMPLGGRLTIEAGEAKMSEGGCAVCGQQAESKYCLIQISDSGVGMSKEVLSKITEPFYTTKGIGKGTGLGLSVTMGIVQSHSGHLHVYSEPDKGTCVKIYIPVDEKHYINRESDIEDKPFTGNETILIVDDEKILLQQAGKMLARNGYRVLLSDNGKEGLELYGEHKDEIAVVVLDLMMPEMDGAEVIRRLKELNPAVKAVFASGFSEDGIAGNLLKDNNRKFVQKPFEITSLCRAIRELIES